MLFCLSSGLQYGLQSGPSGLLPAAPAGCHPPARQEWIADYITEL